MKTIYLVQTFHLSQGITTLGKFAFNTIREARKHISEVKKLYADAAQVSLYDIEKTYVFNFLSVELCK